MEYLHPVSSIEYNIEERDLNLKKEIIKQYNILKNLKSDDLGIMQSLILSQYNPYN